MAQESELEEAATPGETTLRHAMQMWFLPEVERRQAAGLIPKPFPLCAAQVILHSDGRPNEIRLNEEVRAILDVKYKDGVGDKIGQQVSTDEVERLNSMELPKTEDENCGHFTTILFKDQWLFAFDCVYNKGRARQLVAIGLEFLASAEDALGKGHFRAFIDTLFSAAEISANVLLLVSPRPNAKSYPSHGTIHSRFNQFAKHGNVEREQSASFNELARLRGKARYGKGEIDLTGERASKLLAAVRELVQRASGLVSADRQAA